MSYYFAWQPYVSVAEKRRRAEREVAKLKKRGQAIAPVRIEGRKIAKSFWGQSWCTNLERYSDFENRLPRGRTYVRNGSVVDLQIAKGEVAAMVAGSDLYKIKIAIAPVKNARWKAICRDCAGSIDSLVELLQGRLAKGVMDRVCREGDGLFPSPGEIKLNCSCPDWAGMCKHVAAVLYGVGARLDEEPQFLFVLRGVDENELIASAGQDLPLSKATPGAAKVLDDSDVAALFGHRDRRDCQRGYPHRPQAAQAVQDREREQRLPRRRPRRQRKTSHHARPGPSPSLNGSAWFAPGNGARLQDPKIEDKETRPPTRYNEGTLIEAMQNAWRFIDDEILREPATRKPIRQRTWHRGRLPTRRRRRSRCPSSRWATANLPVAKRILAATDKSIAWLADPSHRDEAIELLVKVARSSIEDAEPQRDCGPARNQSAWRHEAQAARRPGSQCRRHLLRTRVGASRAIRAQSG